jgi:succinoglycan biosynthesis transport protein ExoP
LFRRKTSMLQAYKSPSVRVEQDGLLSDLPSLTEVSLAEHLAEVLGFIRRRFLTVLAVLPLTIGLAAVYLLTTAPLYEGTARVIVDTGNKIQVFQQPTIVDPGNAAKIDSDIEVLKSDNFALSIIKNLHLAEDPEFVGSSSGSSGLLSHLFGPAPPRSESEIIHGIVTAFQRRLTVSRIGMTYVIQIGFKSIDPDRAAEIANAVADGFIVDQLDARYQTIRTATAWMQDRLNELRSQVSAADRAVIDYKASHNIVDTKGGGSISDQDLTALNADLIKARADAVEAKARLDRLTEILNTSNLSPGDVKIGVVTDSLHNEIINKLRTQYLDLAQREAVFSARYGHDHLAVVNIRTQMAEIGRSIVDELKRIAEAYRSDYGIAQARHSSLEKSLAATVTGLQTTNKAAIELRQLESAAQTYHALFDSLQQRYTEAMQQQSLPITDNNARVITRATPPQVRSSPKVLPTLAVATVGGLALGFGLALLLEISDRVFRTARRVEAQLRTECLALIPLIKPNPEVPSRRVKPQLDVGTSRIIRQNDGLFRYVIDAPLTRFAESIRAVKVGMDLGNVAKSNKVIGITSSLPNEGKSLISASLAQLCTPGGARVILIDCDLRQPSLSQKLAPKATKGLIDVLTGSSDIEDVVWTDPSTHLSFLPVVAKSRLTHTSEILASDTMKQLFDRLRAHYDYVIADLSPLAPVIDVRSTTRLVDSYLFVIEWGKTRIGVVEHALSAANEVYENLLGVVLNKVDIKLLSRYDSDRGEYYYNPLYSRYGYTDS